MPILMTSNEGESSPFDSGLATAAATVDRRGAFLTDKAWTRPFVLLAPVDHIFVSATYRRVSSSTVTPGVHNDNNELVVVRDSAYNKIATIYANKTNSADWQIFIGSYSPVTDLWVENLYALTDLAQAFNSPMQVALDIGYEEVGPGIMTVKAYINGVLLYSFDIDLVATGLGRPVMGAWGTVRMNSGSTATQTMYVYDLFVADEPAVGLTLTTLQGSSGGFYTDAAGTYVGISELGVNLSNGLTFGAVGNRSSWIVTPLSGKDYTGSAIGSVVVSFLAARAVGSAANGLQPFVRISGTDYNIGSPIPVDVEMRNYTVSIPDNPATSAGWTAGQVTAGIEFGLQAVTIP